MSRHNHQPSAQAGPDAGPRTRHRRIPVLIGLTAAGGLALSSQVVPASAESVPVRPLSPR